MTKTNKFNFSTFQFYEKVKRGRARRLSIFARKYTLKAVSGVLEKGLEITVIPCSLKDTFSRKKGREKFIDGDNPPKCEKYTLVIPDGTNEKRAFLEWCRATFVRRKEVIVEVKVVKFV